MREGEDTRGEQFDRYLAASKALLDELSRLENTLTTLVNRVLARKGCEPVRAVRLQLLDSCECCPDAIYTDYGQRCRRIRGRYLPSEKLILLYRGADLETLAHEVVHHAQYTGCSGLGTSVGPDTIAIEDRLPYDLRPSEREAYALAPILAGHLPRETAEAIREFGEIADAITGIRVDVTLYTLNCLNQGLEQRSVNIVALVSSDNAILRVVVDAKPYGWSDENIIPLVSDIELKGWLARILKRIAVERSANAVKLDAKHDNIIDRLAAAEATRPPSIEGYRKLYEMLLSEYASLSNLTSETCKDANRLERLASEAALRTLTALRACIDDPVLGKVRLYAGRRLIGEAPLRIPNALLVNPGLAALAEQAKDILAMRCEAGRLEAERLEEALQEHQSQLEELENALERLDRASGDA